jgi:hypothetical protein
VIEDSNGDGDDSGGGGGVRVRVSVSRGSSVHRTMKGEGVRGSPEDRRWRQCGRQRGSTAGGAG